MAATHRQKWSPPPPPPQSFKALHEYILQWQVNYSIMLIVRIEFFLPEEIDVEHEDIIHYPCFFLSYFHLYLSFT